MEFVFSWWIVISIGVYLFLIGLAAFFYWQLQAEHRRRLAIVCGILVFGVGAILYNGIYFVASRSAPTDTPTAIEQQARTTPATNEEVAQQLFGFDVNATHALVLGKQVTNTRESTAPQGTLRPPATTTDARAAYTVSFVGDDGLTYTASLPRSSTPVAISETEPPTVLVRFRPGVSTTGAYYKHQWSDCKTVIANFAIGCQRIETVSDTLTIDDKYRQEGLAKLIEDSFASALLIMPQRMHDQLTGRIS